ncbi:MaoC family dehydratase N-terminal domain-containing protein [Thalassotalea sp. Y01]|uniref:FAS1-like dehydratase domain-containing protein n=1 Tax=Thalassotalea sp. Y01 TaxID=2729613 RepID=UPI00145CA828|nr:MaoC family dehydratase N-terminal domain-containing protein [Thalassotalea sp. Y01]NMP16862.1 MaoC family dehydratase [Thalassotalea sp. Y01]
MTANTDKPSWGKQGTWQQALSYVGKVVGVSKGADKADASSVRRWLEPKEFYSPLFVDDDVAQAAGYDAKIVPSTMAMTLGQPAHWQAGDKRFEIGDEPIQIPIPVIFEVPAPFSLSFATSMEMEFFKPIYHGDEITITHELLSITEKQLKVGKGAFFKQKDTYTNQHDDIVAVGMLDIFRFNPASEEA